MLRVPRSAGGFSMHRYLGNSARDADQGAAACSGTGQPGKVPPPHAPSLPLALNWRRGTPTHHPRLHTSSTPVFPLPLPFCPNFSGAGAAHTCPPLSHCLHPIAPAWPREPHRPQSAFARASRTPPLAPLSFSLSHSVTLSPSPSPSLSSDARTHTPLSLMRFRSPSPPGTPLAPPRTRDFRGPTYLHLPTVPSKYKLARLPCMLDLVHKHERTRTHTNT